MEKSETILRMLTKIPRGKVTTYGELARATRSSPRAIGQVMRRNKHPEKYPCYKVVKSSGEVWGYDGNMKGAKHDKKITLLKSDGVEIKKGTINLQKYMHKF